MNQSKRSKLRVVAQLKRLKVEQEESETKGESIASVKQEEQGS